MPSSKSSSPLRALLVAYDKPLRVLHGLSARGPASVEIVRVAPEHALEYARHSSSDAVIVDGRVGTAVTLVRTLRTRVPTLPILFVAPDASDVAPAMCAGATDFLMSDASQAEALLRLQFLVTAAGRPLSTTRVVGPLHLDRDARSLATADRVVSLTPIELKLFERLLVQPGRPVSRAEIERSIWRHQAREQQGTNVAVVYVSYLRKKLAQLGGVCSIRTIPNVGYSLELATDAGKLVRN